MAGPRVSAEDAGETHLHGRSVFGFIGNVFTYLFPLLSSPGDVFFIAFEKGRNGERETSMPEGSIN